MFIHSLVAIRARFSHINYRAHAVRTVRSLAWDRVPCHTGTRRSGVAPSSGHKGRNSIFDSGTELLNFYVFDAEALSVKAVKNGTLKWVFYGGGLIAF